MMMSIEDDRDVCLYWLVLQVCDGAEAVAKYESLLLVQQQLDVEQGGDPDPVNGRHYDIILMDFEMPVMNGPTATK